MKKSITQESPNGCGIACFAFVCDLTYREAEKFLGPEQSKSNRFIVKHFVEELNRFGKRYAALHAKPGEEVEPVEGTIVLLRRSKEYPVGHYLAFHKSQWMDPRINLQEDRKFVSPETGFRDKLPGKPMYLLVPQN
jgi:hypothetical protein